MIPLLTPESDLPVSVPIEIDRMDRRAVFHHLTTRHRCPANDAKNACLQDFSKIGTVMAA
ncbi:hypothetical protein A6X21_08810 [Planctopirus hydrillae]|uniref:Uncharacterized protein n=1 Tax=Planctopirus hydrillae TaxID=1841610 RepID=A0A1C3E811_9PLAN|nr:hypothetical protein A6X21_08810 [Planctopirus hydrillae]